MSTSPTALLLLLRDPDDAMAQHERMCFAEQAVLPVDAIVPHFMMHGRPSRQLLCSTDAVFVGGSGAYSVLDPVRFIQDAMDTLLEVVELRRPAYASCFGFQGLAQALGGEVIRDDETTEMGTSEVYLTEAGKSDPLFSCLPARFRVQQGHHDRVRVLPSGVQRLAGGDLCPEQAFRVEGAPFWASQFHPELTRERTLDRLHHYRDHYLVEGSEEAEAVFRMLKNSAENSPEVPLLLQRLVRGEVALET